MTFKKKLVGKYMVDGRRQCLTTVDACFPFLLPSHINSLSPHPSNRAAKVGRFGTKFAGHVTRTTRCEWDTSQPTSNAENAAAAFWDASAARLNKIGCARTHDMKPGRISISFGS